MFPFIYYEAANMFVLEYYHIKYVVCSTWIHEELMYCLLVLIFVLLQGILLEERSNNSCIATITTIDVPH